MLVEVVDLGRTVVYQLLLQWVVVEVLLVFVSRDLYRVIAEVWVGDSFGSMIGSMISNKSNRHKKDKLRRQGPEV